MSTQHRKPVMAFVALALLAAGLVGVQRADAHAGRLFAAVAGVNVRVQGTVPVTPRLLTAAAREQAATMGPVFEAVASVAHDTRAEIFGADTPHEVGTATSPASGEARTTRQAAPAAGSSARHHDSAATPAPLTAERGSDMADRTGAAAHVVEGATERLERKAERRTARAERMAERRAARAERRAEKAERRADRVERRATRWAGGAAPRWAENGRRHSERAQHRTERLQRWAEHTGGHRVGHPAGLLQRRSDRAAGAARAPRGSDLRDDHSRGRGSRDQVGRSSRHGSTWPWRR